jgi:large subunit ribosomal protein L14e
MQDVKPELGAVVISKAGRDAGRCFVVLEIVNDEYVLITDGDLRKVQKPKKKKIKHLHVKPVMIPLVKQALAEGRKPQDWEIRQHLQSLGYNAKEKAFEEKKEGSLV